jgi:hypothetical protein
VNNSSATFAVETHNGAIWLCAVSAAGTDMLARFSDASAAARFAAILTAAKAAAHTAGAMGL